MVNSKSSMLRIYVGNTDKINGTPLYETLVYMAKSEGMSGATVYKGMMGFGANSIVHSTKIFAISDDLPMIIEIVDTDEKISAFIDEIQPYLENPKFGMLITKQSIDVIHYSHSKTNN